MRSKICKGGEESTAEMTEAAWNSRKRKKANWRYAPPQCALGVIVQKSPDVQLEMNPNITIVEAR